MVHHPASRDNGATRRPGGTAHCRTSAMSVLRGLVGGRRRPQQFRAEHRDVPSARGGHLPVGGAGGQRCRQWFGAAAHTAQGFRHDRHQVGRRCRAATPGRPTGLRPGAHVLAAPGTRRWRARTRPARRSARHHPVRIGHDRHRPTTPGQGAALWSPGARTRRGPRPPSGGVTQTSRSFTATPARSRSGAGRSPGAGARRARRGRPGRRPPPGLSSRSALLGQHGALQR